MLTPAARDDVLVRDDRPAYRPFAVTVAAVRDLTPGFRRVTFRGPDLRSFGTDGLDQRVKLLLPGAGVPLPDLGTDGDWYARWRALPDDRRPAMRTFTVRAVRPAAGELDVDVARHPATPAAPHGPAARWAATTAPGDPLVVVGPDARSVHSDTGIDYRPGRAQRVLLVGDETALPAVAAVLATPGAAPRASALLELADAADLAALEDAGRADVRVVVRDPHAPGEALDAALRGWLAEHADCVRAAAAPRPQRLEDVDVDRDLLWDTASAPDGPLYAWLAGEAAVVRRLRRTLVADAGVDRSRVAAMGYWRRGRAEG